MATTDERVRKTRQAMLTNIHIDIYREGEWFVAFSPALDVSSYARSEAEAVSRFREALALFLEDTQQKGTLEQVLTGLGWRKRRNTGAWIQPSANTLRRPEGDIVQTAQTSFVIPV
jgi:predicted RNase H-like HicB family nuclease